MKIWNSKTWWNYIIASPLPRSPFKSLLCFPPEFCQLILLPTPSSLETYLSFRWQSLFSMVLYLRSHEVAVLPPRSCPTPWSRRLPWPWHRLSWHSGTSLTAGKSRRRWSKGLWQHSGCWEWENVANDEFDGVNVVVAEGADDVDIWWRRHWRCR